MNISSVLRDHGVGTGIKPEGTAVPQDVLSGKSFINKDGKQVGAMPNRTGNVTGRSISRSGTTLRIAPQTGYYGDTSNVQWSDPSWVADNIKQDVSIFGLPGNLQPRYYATGTVSVSSIKVDGFIYMTGYSTSSYAAEVAGLTFAPKEVRFYYTLGSGNAYVSIAFSEALPPGFNIITGSVRSDESNIYGSTLYKLSGAAYISSTGFRLPVSSAGSYTWIATT